MPAAGGVPLLLYAGPLSAQLHGDRRRRGYCNNDRPELTVVARSRIHYDSSALHIAGARPAYSLTLRAVWMHVSEVAAAARIISANDLWPVLDRSSADFECDSLMIT